MGTFMHACEGEMVCTSIHPQGKVPHFNAQMFLENKTVRAHTRLPPLPLPPRTRPSSPGPDEAPHGTTGPLQPPTRRALTRPPLQAIGKIDEVLGPINQVYFTSKQKALHSRGQPCTGRVR